MEKDILYFYNKYKEGYLPCESINIERYSRKSLTGDVANVLNSMVSNHK
jgi:hypothetical protein